MVSARTQTAGLSQECRQQGYLKNADSIVNAQAQTAWSPPPITRQQHIETAFHIKHSDLHHTFLLLCRAMYVTLVANDRTITVDMSRSHVDACHATIDVSTELQYLQDRVSPVSPSICATARNQPRY